MSEPSVKRFPHHSEDSLYKIMGPGIPGDRISSYLGGPDLLTMKLISRNTNDMMKTHKPVDSNGKTRLQWALEKLELSIEEENNAKGIKRLVQIVYEESKKYKTFDDVIIEGQTLDLLNYLIARIHIFIFLLSNPLDSETYIYVVTLLSTAMVNIILARKRCSFNEIADFILAFDEDELLYTLQKSESTDMLNNIGDCFAKVFTALINRFDESAKKLCTKKFKAYGNWVRGRDTETTLIGNYRRRLKRAADTDPEEVNILNIPDINEFERVLKNNFPIYWKLYSVLQHTCKDYDSETD